MRPVAAVVAVLALGCAAGDMGDMMMLGATDAGLGSDARAPEQQPQPGLDASPKSDAILQADRMADRQSADTGLPSLPTCYPSSIAPCGRVGGYNMCGGYSHIPYWKDGRECAVCLSQGTARTGCTAQGNPDECTGQPRAPLLCVSACTECQER